MNKKRMLLLLIALAPLCAQYLITTPDSLLGNGADYFIVVHPSFTNAVTPLCRLRDSLGLQVKMAQTDLIYSTFPDTSRAKSIRLCMERIYHYWNPRPTYILLVGDAQRGGGANDYVPVYQNSHIHPSICRNLKIPENGGITVWNALGQCVRKEHNVFAGEILYLPQGVYFVSLNVYDDHKDQSPKRRTDGLEKIIVVGHP